MDKGKNWLFEKSNKIDTHLVSLVQSTSLGNLSSPSQKKWGDIEWCRLSLRDGMGQSGTRGGRGLLECSQVQACLRLYAGGGCLVFIAAWYGLSYFPKAPSRVRARVCVCVCVCILNIISFHNFIISPLRTSLFGSLVNLPRVEPAGKWLELAPLFGGHFVLWVRLCKS